MYINKFIISICIYKCISINLFIAGGGGARYQTCIMIDKYIDVQRERERERGEGHRRRRRHIYICEY